MPDDKDIASPSELPVFLEDASSFPLSDIKPSLPSDAEQSSSQGAGYDVVDIRQALRFGAKFFRDIGIWGGVDDNKYKFSIRGPGFQEFFWDGDSLTVKGDLSVQDQFTAGHEIDAGMNVSFNASDSKVYPCRINEILTKGTDLNAQLQSQAISGKSRHFDISDSVKFQVLSMGPGDANSTCRGVRISQDPKDPTGATVTYAALSGVSESDSDACELTTNQVFTASIQGTAGTNLKGRVISDLDTAITVNGQTDLNSVQATGLGLAKYSATKVILFYSKSGSGTLNAQDPTISGTTVTIGTDTVIFTAGANLTVKAAIHFAVGTYLVIYEYGGTTYCRVVTYDGSAFASGAEVTLVAAAVPKGTGTSPIDSSEVLVGYNDGTNIKVVVVSQAASVAIVNAATTLHAIVNASDPVSCYAFGRFTHLVCAQSATTTTKMYLIDADNAVPTSLDTALSVTLSNATTNGAAIAGRANPTTAFITFADFSGAGTSNSLITAPVTFDTNYDSYIGIAAEDIAEGSAGLITVQGVNEAVSGLTGGQAYYVDTDEHLTTVNIQQGRAGVALSATKIVVK